MSNEIEREPIKLVLDDSMKALRHCASCGSAEALVRSGTGPHAIHLDCAGCGKFHNWLGFAEAQQYGLMERIA
jgi:hypothetical protein